MAKSVNAWRGLDGCLYNGLDEAQLADCVFRARVAFKEAVVMHRGRRGPGMGLVYYSVLDLLLDRKDIEAVFRAADGKAD